MNYFIYLRRIIDNPNTPREEYMRAWEELRTMEAQQRYIDAVYAERHAKQANSSDKLTGGQNV
jgi:hypothetical protein